MKSVFFSWRMAVILLMGFSSGIPLALTGSTLQAWMTDQQIDLKTIGFFGLVTAPYSMKFLWAPFLDRFTVPILGRRQGWILLAQLALTLGIAGMAFLQPAANLQLTAILAVMVAFFSATQDIVVDAYRADVLEPAEVGPGASLYMTGYRVAMLVSGALALILADHLPWRTVYLIMAATMATGILVTVFAPQPREKVVPPKSLRDAVVLPFLDFFRRRGAAEVVSFVLLYKIDVVLTTALMTPFFMQLGFTKTDIGQVTKGFGLVASIVGTLAGGALMVRLGIKRSLWTFGISQAISGLSFYLLAVAGHNYWMMVLAIAAENFCSGMGNAAYSGFLLTLCNKRFSATQFALLTSIMALTRNIGTAPSGWLVEQMGWQAYYLLATFASIPSLLLLVRFDRWMEFSAQQKELALEPARP